MHAQTDIMVIKQHHMEIRRQVAANRLARELRANSGKGSGLLGDLSWELARYLEAQDSPQSAFVSADSAGGRPGWTRDEQRLAG